MNSKLIIYNYTLQGCKGILLYQGLSRPIMLKHPEHSEGCFLDWDENARFLSQKFNRVCGYFI